MHFAEKTVHINDNEFHFLSAANCIVTMSLPDKQIFKSILIFFDNVTLTDFYRKYDKKTAELKVKQKIAV